MNTKHSTRILVLLVLGLAAMDSVQARGGGGRGGGGGVRSGGGSVRSSPSVSRPSSSRPTPYSQPVNRSSFQTPVRAPVSPNRNLGTDVRPATQSRSNLPRNEAGLSPVRPANYGSISRPAVSAVTAATVGGAALAANPGLRARSERSGTLPGGADYGSVTGPGGGQAGAISGPRGDFAAIRGPGGNTVTGVRDASGDRGAIRGPRGNVLIDNIPGNCNAINWGGHNYWHDNYYWYAPVWYDDDWHYEYRYPPVGYWYPALPDGYETIEVDGSTYYSSDAMYYQAGTQNGQDGFVVVPPPATNSAGKAMAILQSTCDYLGSVTSFVAEVKLDMDRYLQTGDKVPVSVNCVIQVRQPDRLAVEYKGASDNRKAVYNGQNFTMKDPLDPKISIFGAPPRLEDAIPAVKAKQNVILPLSDLLQRDAFDTISLAIQSAEYVGIRKVDGVDYHHLTFTQEDVDWQLWVQTGDQPLPKRALIQYKKDAKSPRYVWEVLKWELEPSLSDDAFSIDMSAALSGPN